nr:hypothetical protein [Christiangramia forsetii]
MDKIFPSEYIYNWRKKGKDYHRENPESFVPNFHLNHINKNDQPKNK